MSEAAVAERTDASTQGDTSEESQAGNGTDLNEEVTSQQSATDGDSENADSTTAEDEGERLEREAREAEIDRRAEEKAAKLVADSKAKETETNRETARKARTGEINLVTGGFGNLLSQMRAIAKENGVDEDVQEAMFSPLEGHNGKLKPLFQKHYDNATAEVAGMVSDWLVENTPEAQRKAIQEAVDADKPLTEVLPQVVEAMALGSDAVKKAKPEDLIEANKALAAHIAAEKLASYKEGRKKPYPDAEPDTSNAARATQDPTYQELTKMTKPQLDKLPPGVFERVMAQGK